MTRIARYIVRTSNQSIPASYNVGLGLKTAQFYADLTAKTYRGTIYSQDVDGREELVGSYARPVYPQPHGPDHSEAGSPI